MKANIMDAAMNQKPDASMAVSPEGARRTSKNDSIRIVTWSSRDGSIDEIIDVLNESNGFPINRSWLAAKCAWGLGAAASIAYDGSVPVGIVLFGSVPYQVSGTPVQVAVSFETFVSVNYRGRGLFSRLLVVAEEACRSAGFQALLNFPNDSSRPGFVKAGWVPLISTRPYVRPMGSARRWVRALRSGGIFESYRKSFVPAATGSLSVSELQRFSSLCSSFDGLTFDNSASALQYRLDPERSEGYGVLVSEGAGAVFRMGTRGFLKEVQILALGPRIIKPSTLRRLLRSISREYEPHLITHIESASGRGAGELVRSGMLPLNSRTTPFFKRLSAFEEPGSYLLNGIDIHTW